MEAKRGRYPMPLSKLLEKKKKTLMMMMTRRARAFACLSTSPRPWESVLMPLLTDVVSACPLLPVFSYRLFFFFFCALGPHAAAAAALIILCIKFYYLLSPLGPPTPGLCYSFVTYIYPDPTIVLRAAVSVISVCLCICPIRGTSGLRPAFGALGTCSSRFEGGIGPPCASREDLF